MVDLSISVEGASGTTWERMATFTELSETSSLHRLMVSDHLVGPFPSDVSNLEAMISLAYIANRTTRIGFGTHVSPLTFRDPVLLLRQAATLHALSGGRMVLGVGAGWNEREHIMFGYPFGTARDRAGRLDEGLSVIRALMRGEPATYHGTCFHLDDAQLGDAGIPSTMPIMVGGSGPKVTLPLVAMHADIWGAQVLTPEGFAERNALLDSLLVAEGRDPRTVKRVLMQGVLCGDKDEIAEMLFHVPFFPPEMPTPDRRAVWEQQFCYAIGSSEQVHDRLQEYVRCGVDEFVIQQFNFFGIEGRERIAAEIRMLEALVA